MPNFRLAEACVNAFTSMGAYRNARQCLIAYCRISSAVVSSSAADLLPHPLGDDGESALVHFANAPNLRALNSYLKCVMH